ncbi:patatin-like phospholipase family protein [Nocardia takedensis]|uniref:patatin-like phospholipase family protein n=1 Tax=Nocardia takedensis TaxID=259390 RepID=UPI003F7711E7
MTSTSTPWERSSTSRREFGFTTARPASGTSAGSSTEVFDSDTGVPLAVVVTASRSFPGAFPPVVVADRHYIDGGLWSPTNADLAADADIVVVIEPMANRFPPELVNAELAHTVTGTLVRFGPDEATIEVFDTYATNPDLLGGWSKAFQAGRRQADELAERLTAAGWPSPRR